MIIAEAGVNHNGQLDLAIQLCDAAKKSGADIVKFQTWKTEKLITRRVEQADYQAINTGKQESQYDMLKKLEKNFEFLHGECIALGMVAAAYMSLKKKKISSDEFYEIRDMFVPFNLPITIDNIDPLKILETLKHDKKSNGKIVKFILLKKVGKAYIDETVTDEEILAAIREIYFTEEDMKA